MSVQASIEINLDNSFEANLSPTYIIHLLLEEGWTINDHGGITYLPLGDNDGYNWIFQEKTSYDLVRKILKEKEEKKEQIGIVVTWQDTNIGGILLFHTSNLFSINFTINRKIFYIEDKEVTDINWYLVRILPVFYKNNIGLYSYTFEELR